MEQSGRPLRGRAGEWATVSRQLAALRDGSGSVTLVDGRTGKGKTRLLDEIVAAARAQGARVGRSTAERGDRAAPMYALSTALFAPTDPLLEPAALAELRDLPEQRLWFVSALEGFLADAVSAAPLVVVLDDAQWADPGTIAAVETFAGRLAERPIAWFVAYRGSELEPQVAAAFDRLVDAGAARLTLGPLDDAAVAEMITDLLGAVPDEPLLELADSARGTPFWLTEMVLGAREEGLLDVVDGQARLRAARLPARLRDTMRQRLFRLSPQARDIARVASVLGRHVTVDLLVDVLQRPPAELLAPLEELLAADLFAERGAALSFRHDILREAVRETIPVSARRALQRQAADAILAAGAAPVEVALDLAESAEPGDGAAIDVLVSASESLRASDPSGGADLAARAIGLMLPDDARRGAVTASAVLQLYAAGRLDEGEALANDALLRPADEAAVLRSLVEMFALSSDVRADFGRRALELPGLPDAERGWHIAYLVFNVFTAGRSAEAHAVREQYRAELAAGDDPSLRSLIRLVDASLLFEGGDLAGGLAGVEGGIRDAAAAGDLAQAGRWTLLRHEALAAVDRYDEAAQIARQAMAGLHRTGRFEAMAWWETARGRLLAHVGDYPDASAALTGVFPNGPERPPASHSEGAGLTALHDVALRTGNVRLAERCVAAAPAMLANGTPKIRRDGAWMLARSALAAGDPVAAAAHLRALALPDGETVLPFHPFDVAGPVELARIAVAADDAELARQAAATAETYTRRTPGVATLDGVAAHVRGLLDRNPAALAEAITAYRRSPRRPLLAAAHEDAAEVAPPDAVEHLGRALELTTALGASADAARVRARLRRLGVRRRLVATPRVDTGWAALTASERAVADAVARGLTNRETAAELVISPHTVNTHLRHIFRKLGVSSRAELAGLALR